MTFNKSYTKANVHIVNICHTDSINVTARLKAKHIIKDVSHRKTKLCC